MVVVCCERFHFVVQVVPDFAEAIQPAQAAHGLAATDEERAGIPAVVVGVPHFVAAVFAGPRPPELLGSPRSEGDIVVVHPVADVRSVCWRRLSLLGVHLVIKKKCVAISNIISFVRVLKTIAVTHSNGITMPIKTFIG